MPEHLLRRTLQPRLPLRVSLLPMLLGNCPLKGSLPLPLWRRLSLPEEDRSYLSKRYMEDQIVGLLGGRVAEKLCIGDISTGASNDIQRATSIARKMVGTYGMSDRIGTVAFDSGSDEVFIGRTMGHSRSYSEAVAAQMDEEVKAIIAAAFRRCELLLSESREKLDAVAA